jgi:ubiquinone/menaquinone biosynthesis C-methylase UbiE
MFLKNKEEQVQIIKEAYDSATEDYNKNISELVYLPLKFKNSERFKRFIKEAQSCNSGESRIKEYLNPAEGMKYLDVGSCANLVGYKLHEWQSLYYGIDISHKLISVTNSFVLTNGIIIGGLLVAEISKTPFKNHYFDIASAIGVLEYFGIEYNMIALKELNRVVKQDGKLVIDMPNENHPDVKTMSEYENYLGRTRNGIPLKKEFIAALKKFFVIEDIDDSQLMLKYFLRNKKY